MGSISPHPTRARSLVRDSLLPQPGPARAMRNVKRKRGHRQRWGMDGWTDGRDGWTDGRDGWTDGRTDGRTDGFFFVCSASITPALRTPHSATRWPYIYVYTQHARRMLLLTCVRDPQSCERCACDPKKSCGDGVRAGERRPSDSAPVRDHRPAEGNPVSARSMAPCACGRRPASSTRPPLPTPPPPPPQPKTPRFPRPSHRGYGGGPALWMDATTSAPDPFSFPFPLLLRVAVQC